MSRDKFVDMSARSSGIIITQQQLSIVEQNDPTTSAKEAQTKWYCKLWMNLDVVVLWVLIIGVWSLQALPMILFHTSPEGDAPSGDSVCSTPFEYSTTNDVCLKEFANILTSSNCPLDPAGYFLVENNQEASATQFINELTSIGASIECTRKAIPFVCQYLFGLCSWSGISIQPTSTQCEELRDTICQNEWLDIERLYTDLQDCAMFPAEASSCPALNGSDSTNGTDLKDINQSFINGSTAEVLECSEDFYQENGSNICLPSCYSWTPYSRGISILLDVIFCATALIGLTGAAAVIVISCLLRKRMLIFPSIVIVYMMLDVMASYFIDMVSFLDHKKFFCSSRGLFESLVEVTPFCVIAGILSEYVNFQVAVWWLFHIAVLFWKVVFPFHARSFSKVKYIHITCVIVAILLPLVPIIAAMSDFAVDVRKQNEEFLSEGLGFGPTRFPFIYCSITNLDVSIYSSFLIVDIIVASGCTILLIIVWSLYRIHKRKIQQENVKFKFGTGERKLLVVLSYFFAMPVLSTIGVIIYNQTALQLNDSFERYFICEGGGNNPNNSCSLSEIRALINPSLDILIRILSALFPVMNLLYVVNIQELKELWRNWLANHH